MKIKKLLILNHIHDIDQIKSLIKENEIEIYSLNFSVHSILNENKIPHVMSEELLTEDDLNKIFDKTAALYGWHDNIEKNTILSVMRSHGVLEVIRLLITLYHVHTVS